MQGCSCGSWVRERLQAAFHIPHLSSDVQRHHFRSSPRNGHRQASPACLKRAMNGLMHHSKGCEAASGTIPANQDGRLRFLPPLAALRLAGKTFVSYANCADADTAHECDQQHLSS
jgi:hypothetical protein